MPLLFQEIHLNLKEQPVPSKSARIKKQIKTGSVH
jgi:hypothetical protein